jgi:peptide/nickel transport system permease protein
MDSDKDLTDFSMRPGLSRGHAAWKELTKFGSNPPIVASMVVLLLVVISAVFAPVISPHDPIEVDLTNRLTPMVWQEGGSISHIFGTDQLGRDILSRLIHGAKFSLLVAIPATLLSVSIGVGLGLWAGYAGGSIERFLMRWVDFQRSIPPLILAILVLAFIGSGILPLVLFLGFYNWIEFCRVVRGQTLSVRENVYIDAAKSIGAGPIRIVFRHMFPNVVASIIVMVTFFIPFLVIIEAILSFLGLGVQPPSPSWGNMLSGSRGIISTAPRLVLVPAVVLSLTVLAFNIFGDRLRERLDPRLRRM